MKRIFFLAIVMILFLGGCGITEQPKTDNNDANTTVDNSVSIPASKSLDLSGQGLKKVPESVFKQTGLEELNLADNELTGAIQGEIRFLQKLKVLNLSGNLLTGVPAEVGQLKNLQVLDLSNNQLTGLPNELGNLKNLKTLNISGNEYSTQDLDGIIKNLPADVVVIK